MSMLSGRLLVDCWKRFAITNERIAVPWPAVHAIAQQQLENHGQHEAVEITELAADACLRSDRSSFCVGGGTLPRINRT